MAGSTHLLRESLRTRHLPPAEQPASEGLAVASRPCGLRRWSWWCWRLLVLRRTWLRFVCVNVVVKMCICKEFSEATMMLTSGDRLMDNGDGVGLSLGCCHHAAKQSKHEAPVLRKCVYEYDSDDITVRVVAGHSCSKTTFVHIQT
jgi:hypothetical protein